MNTIGAERRSRHHGMWPLVGLTAGLVGLVLSVSSHTWQGHTDAVPAAGNGAALFRTYCASCHGAEATGHGPVARALRHAPADLTQLAKKNGGMFPTARVHRIIAGRDIQSHGDRDMPVWGDAFTTRRDGRSRAGADARIAEIVRYLESIQQREAN